MFAGINNSNGKYSPEYLSQIENGVFKRADSIQNGGNGDGKVNVNEALKDLNIGGLLSGLDKKSDEYKNLKSLTNKIPEVLAKYAGKDGTFTAREWADFLNGEEWGNVINTYHSSSNFAKIEMGWIDNSRGMYKDGQVTKGEIKVGIFNDLMQRGIKIDTTEIEALIDKYAGEDGTFTVEEYTNLKKDKKYAEFLKKYNATPFN